MAEFQDIRASFEPLTATHWSKAVAYFAKYEQYVVRLRNNVGGHFGAHAGESAIKSLLPDAAGNLEVVFSGHGGGAKLHFAAEIAATGTLRHVPGGDIPARARRLLRHAVVGYRWAARAVDCITITYLWNRFGR